MLSREQLLRRAIREIIQLSDQSFFGTVEITWQDGYPIMLHTRQSRKLANEHDLHPCPSPRIDEILVGQNR